MENSTNLDARNNCILLKKKKKEEKCKRLKTRLIDYCIIDRFQSELNGYWNEKRKSLPILPTLTKLKLRLVANNKLVHAEIERKGEYSSSKWKRSETGIIKFFTTREILSPSTIEIGKNYSSINRCRIGRGKTLGRVK